jgi:hypothetical protein
MMNNTMTNESTNIERIVMQRVHLIRALRFAISGGVFSTLISMLALWGLGREVWVAHVLQNAPANILDIPRFYFAAFIHTRLVVQALIVLITASFIFLVREIARAVSVMSSEELA